MYVYVYMHTCMHAAHVYVLIGDQTVRESIRQSYKMQC